MGLLVALLVIGGIVIGVVGTYLVIRFAIMAAVGRGLGW